MCLYCATGEFGPGAPVFHVYALRFLTPGKTAWAADRSAAKTPTHAVQHNHKKRIPTSMSQLEFEAKIPKFQAVDDSRLHALDREANEICPFVYTLKNSKHKTNASVGKTITPRKQRTLSRELRGLIFIYLRTVSSAITHVSLTRIGYNTADKMVNAVCITRTFAYAC